MTFVRAVSDIGDWCAERGVNDIVVVSPHLDDGVLSAHTVLAQPLGPRKLLATIFSDAPVGGQTDWARAAGFATTEDEFIARRLEDEDAARAMGATCIQLDEHAISWSSEAAERVARRLTAALRSEPEHSLFLLPAGAGGQLSRIAYCLRRARRVPIGAMPHGEHLAVRDLLLQPLCRRGAQIGFYAELPYVWADRVVALKDRLSERTGRALAIVTVLPNVDAKHGAVSVYRSQLALILGVKPVHQRRVLAHSEVFFMPG